MAYSPIMLTQLNTLNITANNDVLAISDAALLKKIFSMSSDTTLYVQAVTAWNSANINFYFVLRKVN